MSAVAITTKKDLTPEQAAKLLGKSRRFVIALIKTGELEARNEKAPGSKQNRFRIPPHAPDAWRETRRVAQLSEREQKLRRLPRMVGILDQRIAAIEARSASEDDRRQIA